MDYLQWASAHDPSLQAMRHEAEARRQEARQAGSLPDLKVGYGEMLVPVETRVGPQQRAFSLAQPLPWFGTLGLREQVQLDQVEAQEHRIREGELSLHLELRQSWYRLALTQKEKVLTGEQLALIDQLEAVVRSSYETGKAEFGQLLRIQAERDDLAVQLANLTDLEAQQARDLYELASLPVTGGIPEAELVLQPLPWAAAPELDLLVEIQQRHHPGLLGLAASLQSARTARELAGKEGWPGLTFGLDYIMTGAAVDPALPDSGKDPVIARVGLSLPIWGGKSEARRQKAASFIAVQQSRYDDRRRHLARELNSVLYRETAGARRLALYQDSLLPRARQAQEVASAAYQSGQVSFADYIQVRRDLLDLQLAFWQSQHDVCVARDELITLLGGAPALSPSLENSTEKMP